MAGQSGIRPPPQTPSAPGKAKYEFVPDPNRDEYQLAFTKRYELKRGQKIDQDQQWEQYTAGFIDELNRIGAQGYRLISIALSPRLAVLGRSMARRSRGKVQRNPDPIGLVIILTLVVSGMIRRVSVVARLYRSSDMLAASLARCWTG